MSFSVHTFETNPKGNLGFAFHQNVGEGQELYFLAKFSEGTSDPQSIAEAIFGTVVDHFESSSVTDPYDKFEDALKATNETAKKLKNKIPKTPEMILGFFDFHHLYLSQSGSSEAYMIRGENVSQISELPEESDDLFLNILSGQVSINDIVIFSSHRILRTITANQLSEMFSQKGYSEAVSIFRHKLSSSSEEDTLVTIVGIGKKEEAPLAGFLSKVMSKKDDVLDSTETVSTKEIIPETPIEPPEDEITSSSLYTSKNLQDEEEILSDNSKLKEKIVKEEPIPQKTQNTSFFLEKLKKIRFNKNIILIIGTIVSCLLLFLFVSSRSGSEEEAALRNTLSLSREALDQASVFILQGETELAKEQLATAEKSAQAVFNSKLERFRNDAKFVLADIDNKKLQVENAKEVTPNLVADLGVKNNDLEAVGLLSLRGNSFVFDLKNIYKTIRNIVEKGLPILDKETIIAGVAREDQSTLIILSDNPRIIEYREGILTPMRTTDETWKRGIDIKNYGRYAYILDPVENQIWKYERKRDTYGAAIAYNQGADLSRAVSFTIDGSIYIISDEGILQKIFRGQKQDYEFRDLPSIPFRGKNLKVYTTQELDFLYVLDPDNERVLIFVKGDLFATYKKQILFGLPDARDFTIDNSGQKVNIVTKDKIYEFSL
ncbi:hypothetical protein KAI58_04355 [Candidatus Gracilibacteria bacterium]|nr:hypothetical protein [Candidatus Gracilibacteria bacterium]